MSRRSFLKASGATGIVFFAATRVRRSKPAEKSLPKPPEARGVVSETYLNTSCLNCPARCAISVRVANGKVVRITGNPLSMVSEGQICPRGHVGLQVLYDENRITTPLKRTNPKKGADQDPGWSPVSWDDALNDVSSRLGDLRDQEKPHALAIFGGLNARSDEDLLERFARAYGTPNLILDDALESRAEKTGRWLADGNYSSVAYDLGRTNYVLAFGAGILESERPLARNLRMWGKMRREKPARGKVVVFDPRYSVTAAKADQWVPIKPGTDAAMALAIANVLISEGLYDREFVDNHATGFDKFREAVLNAYSPEQMSGVTGVKPEAIRRIAGEFGRTRPALAWAGRGVAGWPNGSLAVYSIFCLNALAGSIDSPGGVIYQEDPNYRALPDVNPDRVARTGALKPRIDALRGVVQDGMGGSANKVPGSILSGQPYATEMAIGFNSNFNMTEPGSPKWDESLRKLPYYIHVSPYISEMALYADVVLPAATYLEQWGYDHSPPGSGFAELKVKQPVVDLKPDVKSVGDIVFQLAMKTGGSVSEAFTGIGDSAEGFVRFRTETVLPFEDLTKNGVWVGPEYKYGKYGSVLKTPSGKFEFFSAALREKELPLSSVAQPGLPRYVAPAFQGDEKEFPFVLTTYQPVLQIESGSQNYPWAQEVYFVMHGVGWNSLAEMNADVARSIGVKDGEEVWVESAFSRIKAKARVTEWVSPDCVAMARGQGHYAPGRWHKGIGVNPNDITGIDFDWLSGQPAIFNTRVKVYRA